MSVSRRIHALDPQVVNRIAAGEVVIRPASAVKELVENSIDAGSTNISVTAKNGGIKSFHIQDNGCGIHKDDLAIVCERFTTSKLQEFDDLQTINTYGFRGEALASITHVGRVTITSKTETQPCAFRATYLDGKLAPIQPGKPAVPRPCAGKRGTIIMVDDLFYNMENRRRALKSPAEEYSKILDIVSKYAVHCGISKERSQGISLTCKKTGTSTSDLHTSADATIQDNIRQIYGASIGNELLEFSMDTKNGTDEWEARMEDGTNPQYALHGLITNANFSRKKSEYIMFINHRLVSCASLKRALESVYSEFLPRGSYPFVYLSLTVPSQNVDVNVHPTKSEVHFLDEASIVNQIQDRVRQMLQGANESRVFYSQSVVLNSPTMNQTASDATHIMKSNNNKDVQTKLKSANSVTRQSGNSSTDPDSSVGLVSSSKGKRKLAPNKFVRTDSQSQSLQSFYGKHATRTGHRQYSTGITRTATTSTQKRVCVDPISEEEQCDVLQRPKRRSATTKAIVSPTKRSTTRARHSTTRQITTKIEEQSSDDENEAQSLASVQELVSEFVSRSHGETQKMFKDHVFVGLIDDTFALIQVGTGLYTIDYSEICKELVYQNALLHIGDFEAVVMDPPLPLREILRISVQANTNLTSSELETELDKLCKKLLNFAEMLKEYFAIELKLHGGLMKILSLPQVVNGLVPSVGALPVFLHRLCEEVDWTEEKVCLKGIAWELAEYYAQLPAFNNEEFRTGDSGATPSQKSTTSSLASCLELRAIVQDIVFTACRSSFHPPPEFANPSNAIIVRVARLENLYKIFERC